MLFYCIIDYFMWYFISLSIILHDFITGQIYITLQCVSYCVPQTKLPMFKDILRLLFKYYIIRRLTGNCSFISSFSGLSNKASNMFFFKNIGHNIGHDKEKEICTS